MEINYTLIDKLSALAKLEFEGEEKEMNDELSQIRAVHEFHDEEVKVLALPEVEHVDDCRMAESCHRSSLASKPLGEGRIITQVRPHQLHGNKSVELRLLCLIDNTHAAGADLVDDLQFWKQRRQLVEVPRLTPLP